MPTSVSDPAIRRAAVTVWLISERRRPPKARATRMLTETPMAPRVTTRMNTRLLAKPTAAIAVEPRTPTMTWLTKLRTRMRTNSRLTGTAMPAMSRRSVAFVDM